MNSKNKTKTNLTEESSKETNPSKSTEPKVQDHRSVNKPKTRLRY